MTEEDEKTLLGSEYTSAVKNVIENVEQMEGAFVRFNSNTGFEDTNPLDQDRVEKNEELDKFQADTGVPKADLFMPFGLTQPIVEEIQALLSIGDPLNMSESELASIQSRANAVVTSINVPTADDIQKFLAAYTALSNYADGEDNTIPFQTQDMRILSTDVNLDSFIRRTGYKKAMIIELNKLQFPYIAERIEIPSQKQGDLVDPIGVQGEFNLTFSSISYLENAGTADVGSKILISNNARFDKDLIQQKFTIDFIDETLQELKLSDALLFDVDSTYSVEVFQDTVYQILEVGKTIKVPA